MEYPEVELCFAWNFGISRGKVKKWKIPEGFSKKYILKPTHPPPPPLPTYLDFFGLAHFEN